MHPLRPSSPGLSKSPVSERQSSSPQAAETAGVNPRQLEEIEITYMTILKQEGLWAALSYYLHGNSLVHGSVT